MLINRRIIVYLILSFLIGKNLGTKSKGKHKKVDSLLAGEEERKEIGKAESFVSIGEKDKESPPAVGTPESGQKASSILPLKKRQSARPSLLQQEQEAQQLAPSLLQQEQLAPSMLQQEQLAPSLLPQRQLAPSLLQQEQQEQLAPSLLQQEQEEQLAPSLLQKEEQLKQEQQEELTPSLLHKRQLAWSLSRQKQLASSFLQEEQLAPSLLPQKKQLAPSLLQKEQLKKEQKEKLAPILQEQQEQLAPSLLQKGEKAPSLLQHGKLAPSLVGKGEKAPSLLQHGKKAPSLLQHGKLAPSLLGKDEKAPSLLQHGKLAPSLLGKGEKAQSLVQKGEKAQSLVQSGKLAPSLLSPTEPAADSDVNLNILNEGRRAGTWLDSSIIDAYLERIVSSGRPGLEFVPNFIIDMYVGNKKEHAEEIGNWIMKIDWLAIQLLFVPVFLAPNHWAMGVYRPSDQEFTMFDSNTALGRVSEKIEFMGKMTEFFADIAQIHGQNFDEDVHLVERTNTPQQDNDSDCGVFVLMFAYYIGKERRILGNFNHCNMNAKAFREKIYQDLYAIKFGTQTTTSLRGVTTTSSETGSGSDQPTITTSIGRGREMEKSRRNRYRSVHKLPDKERIDKEADMVKAQYYAGIFDQNYNEREHMHIGVQVVIGLFHFKKLSFSMLLDYKKRHLDNENEAFRRELDARIGEFLELVKLDKGIIEQFACIFFKFFMKLVRNASLLKSEEWNKYMRFRMRHFYWIDPKWDENSNVLMQLFKMREKTCTEMEWIQFSKHIANTKPYSSISHWWALKWLLQNSPQFIEQIEKYNGGPLLTLKKRIFTLVGESGFEQLEMGIPALKLHSGIEEMKKMGIKRYLSGGIEGTKSELRVALSYLLNFFLIFYPNPTNLSAAQQESLQSNLKKLHQIYVQIVEIKLPRLVDEEHSLEEEVEELKEAVCIVLKFFDENDGSIPSISIEKFFSISYEQAMACTATELESTLERQRSLLNYYYYMSISNHLSEGDTELENVLKYKEGAIYRLKELISLANLLTLWNGYHDIIRDKKYFSETLDQIRQSAELFLTAEEAHIRQLNKAKLNIYVLMRWLDATLRGDRYFSGLMEGWHCLFRSDLDEMSFRPENVNTVDIESSIMSGKIMEFVEKWHGKVRSDQRVREEYGRGQEERENLMEYYLDEVGIAPPLMERFQRLLMITLQELANQDKAGRRKKVATSMNFWQYFYDLYNHQDRITRIGELLNINSLKEMHQLLGLTFYEDRFRQLGEVSRGEQELIRLEPTLGKEKSKKKATSIARVQSLLEEETSIPRAQSLLKKDTSIPRAQSLLKEDTSIPRAQSLLKEGGGEEGLSKSAKKKLKRNKSKVSTTSTEDEEKKSAAGSIKLRRSESTKGSGRGGGRAGIGVTMEMAGGALRRSESAKEAKGGKTLPQSIASKFSDTEDAEQRRRRNLRRFNLEHRRSSIASAEGGTPSWRREETTSAPRGSQILESGTTHGSSAKEQIKEFLEGSRSRTTERQRSGGRQTLAKSLVESEQQQQLLMFLHKSCWKNNHLYMLYENFLTNPTILMRAVLDACVYINETYAKLSLAEIISDYGRRKWPIPLWQINGGKVERLKEKWQQIVDQQLVLVKAKEDIDKLKTNLHALLYQVQMVLNEGGGGEEGRQSTSLIGSSSSMEEMGDALFQMHSIKLSHFLCIKSESQRWIDEFMERSKNAVFGLLHQSEDLSAELRVSRKNYQRFLDRIEAWDKYENQRALDDQLVTQYRVRDDDFMPRKSHYWQQIILGNTEKETHSTMTKDLQEKIKFVDRFIEAAERMEYERAQTFKTAVDAVEQIAREWNKDAELLHTGSYLIGALTVNSDVDTICMLPERITLDMFFGNAKCEIVETKPGRGGGISRTRTCADHSSLHCAFCLNPNVMYLSKVETARVPLLKFSYCLDEDIGVKKFTKCEKEVEFDLLFAAVKQAGVGYDIDGHAKLLQAMDERAMDREQIATYTSLTGYQQNTAINGVLSRNKRNFRITVAAIKHWAKKYHIYNPFHGFLKGIGVTIMAAKIATMFPNSTVPFLLQMFFFYFLEWPWKMPVQLMKVQNLTRDGKPFWEIEERSKREQWHAHLGISTELMMPVVSPWREDDISFSSSNVMTENTREIVFKAMQNALYSLNQIQAGKADWDLLLNGMDISAEYQYFIVINCGRRYQKLSDDLCSFANSKLANQIIYDVVKNNRNFTNIRRAHIMHTAGDSDNRCIVPGGGQVYNTHFCKTWLVGIKFFPRGENNFLKEHFEQRLHKENLLIVEKYMGTLGRKENKQKFDEFTRNRAEYFILSKFVQLKELAQWGITLRGSEIVHQ